MLLLYFAATLLNCKKTIRAHSYHRAIARYATGLVGKPQGMVKMREIWQFATKCLYLIDMQLNG